MTWSGTASSTPAAGYEISVVTHVLWEVCKAWGGWPWSGLVSKVQAVGCPPLGWTCGVLATQRCVLANRRHWKHARPASPRWSCSSSSSKWCSWRGWRMPRPGTCWGSSSTSSWPSWLSSSSSSPLWPTASCPSWRLAIGRSALYL